MAEQTAIAHHEAPDLRPADPMVSMIERVAMDPGADLAKLEKMLDMRDRHEAAQAKAAFSAAFAQASGEFPTIPLNGKGHNQKPYATLKDITRLTRPILSSHGLALTFSVETLEKTVRVSAELMHRDGYSKSTSIDLPADTSGSKNAVQAIGSTQTYGQRYTAQAILGLSLGDDTEDDGQASTGSAPISEAQWREISALIDEAGITEEIVCQAERLSHLTDLPAARFDHVRSQLETTIKKRRAAQ